MHRRQESYLSCNLSPSLHSCSSPHPSNLPLDFKVFVLCYFACLPYFDSSFVFVIFLSVLLVEFRVLCILGNSSPPTHSCTAQQVVLIILELSLPLKSELCLPLPPECWDGRCVPGLLGPYQPFTWGKTGVIRLVSLGNKT